MRQPRAGELFVLACSQARFDVVTARIEGRETRDGDAGAGALLIGVHHGSEDAKAPCIVDQAGVADRGLDPLSDRRVLVAGFAIRQPRCYSFL